MRIAMDFFEACEKLSGMLADRTEQLAEQFSKRAAECADSLSARCAQANACCGNTKTEARDFSSAAADEVFDAGVPRWV